MNENINEVANVEAKSKKEKMHDYYVANKDKIKERARQRIVENPQLQIQYNKKYLEKNKEKYDTLRNQKFQCSICGGSYTYSNFNKHIMATKHVKMLSN